MEKFNKKLEELGYRRVGQWHDFDRDVTPAAKIIRVTNKNSFSSYIAIAYPASSSSAITFYKLDNKLDNMF